MRDDKLEIYPDEANEWRWRFVRSNGKILADSGEGYKNHEDCLEMARYVVMQYRITLKLVTIVPHSDTQVEEIRGDAATRDEGDGQ